MHAVWSCTTQRLLLGHFSLTSVKSVEPERSSPPTGSLALPRDAPLPKPPRRSGNNKHKKGQIHTFSSVGPTLAKSTMKDSNDYLAITCARVRDVNWWQSGISLTPGSASGYPTASNIFFPNPCVNGLSFLRNDVYKRVYLPTR